jgi:sugar phosphate isomerase/epimerase
MSDQSRDPHSRDQQRDWTRREWLWLMAASTLGGSALLHAQGTRPWGVQLYTVRNQLKTDPAGTLKAIAGIGYKEVELFGTDFDKIAPLAKEAGLTPVSTHIDGGLVLNDTAEGILDSTFDGMAKQGIKYALMAYIMPNLRGKEAADYKKFGDRMNHVAASAKKAGLAFGYHNHAFEFGKLADGTRPIDTILETFDPSLVRFEVDVFWVSVTGNDPVEFINKLGKRVMLVHLKDKAKGTPVKFEENVEKEAFAEVGSGSIDFPAVIKAAQAVGVEHYFVEQDQSPDPLASLKKSYEYLSRQS